MENVTTYEITGLIYGFGLGLFLVFVTKEGINKLKQRFSKPVATNVNYTVTIYNDLQVEDMFVHYYWCFDSLIQANQFIDTLCYGCYSHSPLLELHECTYDSFDTSVKSVFLKSIRLGDEYKGFYIISDRPLIQYDHTKNPK